MDNDSGNDPLAEMFHYEHHPVEDIEPCQRDEVMEKATQFVTKVFLFLTEEIRNDKQTRMDARRVIGRVMALVIVVRPDLIPRASRVAERMGVTRAAISKHVQAVRREFGITTSGRLICTKPKKK